MSSPPSSAESDTRPASAGSSTAFLVYSPDTLKDNLHPDVDNKPLARQKRKRTSPEDQKVLEDEFARNPKPDKASRVEILKKVTLGEKEIQIWFQNRRQASRRRAESTTELPGDATREASEACANSHDDPTASAHTTKDTQEKEDEEIGVENQKSMPIEGEAASDNDGIEAGSREEEQLVAEVANEEDSQRTALTVSMASTAAAEPSSSQTILSSQDTSRSTILKPGYFANRRSASFVRLSQETVASPNPSQPTTTPTLARSGSSYLRLSMTEDGQARVIDRTVPSPPRSQHLPPLAPLNAPKPAGLRRSYSAAGLNDMFNSSGPEPDRNKFARVSQTGRSRDSRAWEFWCDSETRNSLADKAEQESSGSAANAIGLIRQSSRGALRPNPRKGNTPILSQGSFSQGKKPARPALQRANTTHGFIQPSKKGSEADVWDTANTDSDKENWEPEDSRAQSQIPRGQARPHGPNPRAGRKILGENTQMLSQSGSLGAMMSREKRQQGGRPQVDSEVQDFMGTSKGVSSGENIGDELDCVQSLLSLSKGNWK